MKQKHYLPALSLITILFTALIACLPPDYPDIVTLSDEVVSISVTQNPSKTTYYVNEIFNPAGLEVTAVYSDGWSETVTGYTLSTPNMSTAGIRVITVTLQDMTARFIITVNPREGNLEDFSNGFEPWTPSASGNGASPPVIITEDGKPIIEFDSRPMYNGGRVILSRTVNFSGDTALTFSVKTDIGGSAVSTFLKLYIDDVEQASYFGLDAPWKTYTVSIPAGSHEIKFVLEKDSGSYYPPPRTNKVWLADISFSPDATAYLDMQPKGRKDTYVGGFPIQFTASAFRSNGSALTGVSGIVYSGSGVNSATGVFTPPTTPGNYTVTASLDGKTVSSNTITVHPADYMQKPYTNPITEKTHNGYQGAAGTLTMGSLTFTYPAERIISADGFVTFEGESNYSTDINVNLSKNGDSSLTSSYKISPGRFSIRIWLRFGPGQYTIGFYSTGNTFTVTNTCTDTGVEGDPRFLYPSYMVQSDDFRITNLLSDLLYGVTNEAEKIKIIHDYLVQNTLYDMASFEGDVRKSQDALSVLGTRYHYDSQYEPAGHFFAVCEGYSNAMAALLRAAGIETRYISSSAMNHGWNHVYTGGSWKFLDVTWDDPIKSGTQYDFGPSYVRYKYYLLTTMDGVDGDHYNYTVNNGRSIIPVIPKMKGMPDGWY